MSVYAEKANHSSAEIIDCLVKFAKSIVSSRQDAANICQELINRGDLIPSDTRKTKLGSKMYYHFSERSLADSSSIPSWRIFNGYARAANECDISGYVMYQVIPYNKEWNVTWAKVHCIAFTFLFFIRCFGKTFFLFDFSFSKS